MLVCQVALVERVEKPSIRVIGPLFQLKHAQYTHVWFKVRRAVREQILSLCQHQLKISKVYNHLAFLDNYLFINHIHRYSRTPLVTTSVPKTLSATGVITASPSSSPQVCVSSAVASTSGQVLVGGSGSVFNVSPPTCAIPTTLPMPAISVQLQSTPTIAAATSGSSSVAQVNPFILKFKTNLIKVCQSCRNNYEGLNDTMGLVARAERPMISNVVTGVQFLGRESNSHYHCRLSCLQTADVSFQGKDLVIHDDVRFKLTHYQKLYLLTCLQIPLI